MFFKPFTHLARQTVSKTLSHPYAHPAFAASQSKHNVSQPHFTQLGLKYARSGQSQSSRPGLATYQPQHGESLMGSQIHIFQYPQCDDVEIKPLQTIVSGDRNPVVFRDIAREKQNTDNGFEQESPEIQVTNDLSFSPTMTNQGRGYIGSVVNSNDNVTEKIREVVAQELRYMEEDFTDGVSDAGLSAETRNSRPTQSTSSGIIAQLVAERQFDQIPATFEFLLQERKPLGTETYNCYLRSLVNIHSDIDITVSKSLSILSDMTYHQVPFNQLTFKVLLELLSAHFVVHKTVPSLARSQRFKLDKGYGQSRTETSESFCYGGPASGDHQMVTALELFSGAVSRFPKIKLSTNIYHALITFCARNNNINDVIRIVAHMEGSKTLPHASIFPLMIDAFAANGNLASAVKCYNEYKLLAIADDNGIASIVSRADSQVYSSIVCAYLTCDKPDVAARFFEKTCSSKTGTDSTSPALPEAEMMMIKDAYIKHALSLGNFEDALNIAQRLRGDRSAFNDAVSEICVSAADANDLASTAKAYATFNVEELPLNSIVAMLALHCRQGDLTSARLYWNALKASPFVDGSLIHLTAMYTTTLLQASHVGEALLEARTMFSLIHRLMNGNFMDSSIARQYHDEAKLGLDHILRVLRETVVVLTPEATMNLMWTMAENVTFTFPLAEYLINNLGQNEIGSLNNADLALAFETQARIISNLPKTDKNIGAHPQRFSRMLEVCLARGILGWNTEQNDFWESAFARVQELRNYEGDGQFGPVLSVNRDINATRPDVPLPTSASPVPLNTSESIARAPVPNSWSPISSHVEFDHVPLSPTQSYVSQKGGLDPYLQTTDMAGSNQITDTLENPFRSLHHNLKDAFESLTDMRRGGYHPRYSAYAKLIFAASRAGRIDIAKEVFGMASQDVPMLQPQSPPPVWHGWTTILDSMVAACLIIGDRGRAKQYHQRLLSMGSMPSSNTFGLYITTLKGNVQTYDEATEAVKIFQHAAMEGVKPTSFLYNALIAKLGKARRIDDCLAYFAEMRAKSIWPTSVTYGTVINALCRVSDEKFAEELFDEMESMPDYKPRPAPYNSIIQYFLNTKRDRRKVLEYYDRMMALGIQPTKHTFKLLIDAYSTIQPVHMDLAEDMLSTMQTHGQQPDATHYASLIHSKGCVMNDITSARTLFDELISKPPQTKQAAAGPSPCLYQAMCESLVANHMVHETTPLVASMAQRGVKMTAYIANTLIHGWAAAGNITSARKVYDDLGIEKREPSTYEAMTRAYLAVDVQRSEEEARGVVAEMVSRRYPPAVTGKVLELIDGGGCSGGHATRKGHVVF